MKYKKKFGGCEGFEPSASLFSYLLKKNLMNIKYLTMVLISVLISFLTIEIWRLK